MDISRIHKLLGALVGVVTAIIADQVLDLNDLVTAVTMLLPLITVYFAPANSPATPEGA